MRNWQEVKLEELGKLSSGKSVKPGGVGEFTVFGSNGAIGGSDEYRHPRGVIIGRVGAYCGSVEVSDRPFWASDNTIVFEPDRDTDLRFAYYLLKLADLNQHAGGSAQPLLTQRSLKALRFRIPDEVTRVRISDVLGSIDDLIENNRRRIEVLEEMAQAIYQEWFVNFRYPGHQDATLVDSPLGPIPEGWETVELRQLAIVNHETRKPVDDEIIRYLDISCLGDRWLDTPPEISGDSAPGRARRCVKPGDVVWSMVRPNRRAHALLVEPSQDWIASTGLAVLTPHSVSPGFLFETVSSPNFSDYLVSQEGGSAYPAVKPKDFETAPLVRPRSEVESAFAATVEPMHRQAWALRVMSDRLAATRDLLLPRLVTGEIDVSELDLDALVGAAS